MILRCLSQNLNAESVNFLRYAESAVDSALTSSLRGSLSEAKTTKQFAEFASEAKQPSIN
ncbi:hypothetical protein [Helicobacter sp. 23-1045]